MSGYLRPEELAVLLSDHVTDALHPPGSWVFIQDVVGLAWRAANQLRPGTPLEDCWLAAYVDDEANLQLTVRVRGLGL